MTSTRTFLALRNVALCVILASHAAATTYVIDDSGGPGVDFTNIPAAIAAASPGDVLLVRAGSYSAFTLTKGLSILGESGVLVGAGTSVDVVVRDLPLGQVAVLTDFSTEIPQRLLRLENCHGTVILQRVTSSFEVTNSPDVRMWAVSGKGYYSFSIAPGPFNGSGLFAQRARVEVVQSTMTGANGYADETSGDRGSPGVSAAGPGLGALVHLALTSCAGGAGGHVFGGAQGRGGYGVLDGWDGFAAEGCSVVIAGGNQASIQGGHGSVGGSAIGAADPLVQYSGVALIPGSGPTGGMTIETNDPSNVVAPTIADPTLGIVGSASPGGSVLLQVRAEPRSKAFLFFGRRPVVEDDGLAQIARLVDVVRARKLGLVPLSGQKDQAWAIPANASVGDLFVFQAAVILPNGEYRRTNSVPVVVR